PEPQRLLVGLDRFVVVPALPERVPQLAPGLREVWLERGRLAEVRLGFEPLVRRLQDQSLVVNALGGGGPRRGGSRLQRGTAGGERDRGGEDETGPEQSYQV